MKIIDWFANGVSMPEIPFKQVEKWIDAVVGAHSLFLGEVNYIFCDDENILRVNNEFLSHDYYTDVITFDYTHDRFVSGDIFISLDTVKSNSELFSKSYENELYRVIIHGILHLCGINDKGPGEREIMESHENTAISMLQNFGIVLS